MNKAQKEVQQAHLKNEKHVIELLKKVYEQASKDCDAQIRKLSERTDFENLQTIIWQKQYQEALKSQLESIMDNLHTEQYTTIDGYLQNCYKNGYTGAMYDIAKQGIPVVMPIRQDQVAKAVQTNSKLSEGLYKRLGEDTKYLKKSVRAELSRGIANGSSWNEMAAHIANGMKSPYNKAYNRAVTIARTEGHRIQQESGIDACKEAKKKGADVVKQWDSTLDGRTRPEHREADGQIRELDDDFDVGGQKLKAPGVGGSAWNVCNCRCCMLQRARWALDEDELQTLKDRAAYFGLDKSNDFDDFKQKYLTVSNDAIDKYDSAVENGFKPSSTLKDAQEYSKKFIGDGYSPTFKNVVNYKGISLDHANEINMTLEELYSKYPDMPKLNGIKAVSASSKQGKKIFTSDDAVAAYNPVEHGIFLNADVLKNAEMLAKYNQNAEDAWNAVMDNLDKLTGRNKELAQNYKNAGRSLVGDGSLHDYITHEIGHHVEWDVLDTKTNNAIGKNMGKYASKISGYATASKGEYIAESFVAYSKGERDNLDPEFVRYLDDRNVAKTKNHDNIKSSNESAKRSTSSLETVRLSKSEYAQVMSEINTHLSDEQRKRKVVTKAIGNYLYTFENNGFDDYRIIGKVAIDGDKDGEIEEF